jgi:hypothetical protein
LAITYPPKLPNVLLKVPVIISILSSNLHLQWYLFLFFLKYLPMNIINHKVGVIFLLIINFFNRSRIHPENRHRLLQQALYETAFPMFSKSVPKPPDCYAEMFFCW